MSDIDIRFFLSFLAPTIAFLVWFLRRSIERRETQDNLVRALFAEIDFNTKDMEIFRLKTPIEAVRERVLADADLVPHITDARHTEIYRNGIGNLHQVSDEILARMVQFYGLLEKIRVQIDAIQSRSYASISPEGRVQAINTIWTYAANAEGCGLRLLDLMQRDYRPLRLERVPRDEETIDASELPARLVDLGRRIEAAKAVRQ